jgi:transposase
MSEPIVPSELAVSNDPTVPASARRRRDPAATRQRWVERLQRFRDGQLTIAQFCANEGVSVPAFYFWKRTLAAPSTGTPLAHQPELVPVRIAQTAPTLEVVLPSGALLRWSADLDPQRLAALLRALGAIPC